MKKLDNDFWDWSVNLFQVSNYPDQIMSDLKTQITSLDNIKDVRGFNQWKFETLSVLELVRPPIKDTCTSFKNLKYRSHVHGPGVSTNNLDELIAAARKIIESAMSNRPDNHLDLAMMSNNTNREN